METLPRADTDTSLQILRAMIVPVTAYAPTITCLLSKRQCEEQDKLLRKAARLAIHGPKTLRNDYVQKMAATENVSNRNHRLAEKYLNNPNRPESIKSLVQDYQTRHATQPNTDKYKSPLDFAL